MIGQSFSPSGGPDQQQRPASNDSPLQQAIQILQLRIPRFFGASATAPSPLIGQQPGGGGFDPMAMLQHLFGQQPPQPGGGMPSPMAPPPMGGMPPGGGPMGGGMPQMPAPAPTIHYQPNQPPPGGTAGPPLRPGSGFERPGAPGPGRKLG